MKELEVQILVRGIENDTPKGDVALEVYKAVVIALREKYAIMGYGYGQERIYR